MTINKLNKTQINPGWQHTCAHFSKKLVHYRAFSKYTFARILFPGKRYDCAHCILLILLLAKFPPALWADSDISARRTTNGCDSLNFSQVNVTIALIVFY